MCVPVLSSPWRSGGINRMIDAPIISPALYPKMCSAPEFQPVMILFKSFPMIPSSEKATIAASRREVISAKCRSVMSRKFQMRPCGPRFVLQRSGLWNNVLKLARHSAPAGRSSHERWRQFPRCERETVAGPQSSGTRTPAPRLPCRSQDLPRDLPHIDILLVKVGDLAFLVDRQDPIRGRFQRCAHDNERLR